MGRGAIDWRQAVKASQGPRRARGIADSVVPPMPVTIRNIFVAAAIAVLAAAAASSGSASSRGVRTYTTHGTLPLRTSLDDPFTLTGPERAMGFEKVRAAGASYRRINAGWHAIAS